MSATGKRINATWRCCGNTPLPRRAHAQSRLVVAGWLAAFGAVVAGLVLLVYNVVRWVWLALQ